MKNEDGWMNSDIEICKLKLHIKPEVNLDEMKISWNLENSFEKIRSKHAFTHSAFVKQLKHF